MTYEASVTNPIIHIYSLGINFVYVTFSVIFSNNCHQRLRDYSQVDAVLICLAGFRNFNHGLLVYNN